MKNKKIVLVTLLTVVTVIVGVYSMSKVVENSWLTTESKENNLESASYGYPYITFNDIKNGATPDWYTNMFYNMDGDEDILELPDGAITYQEIANIIGDAITYTSGITSHQKNTAYLNVKWCPIGTIYNENDEVVTHQQGYKYISSNVDSWIYKNTFVYRNFNELVETEKSQEVDVNITAIADLYTGEIYTLNCHYNRKFLNENPKFSYKLPFGCNYAEGQIEKELLASALEIAELCGCKDEFTRYCVLEYEDYYHVYLESSFGCLKNVHFLKENNNYKLWNYSMASESISPYNFKFKDISF